MMPTDGNSKEQSEYKPSPSEQHQRWMLEFAAARAALKPWHTQAEQAVKAYLAEKDEGQATDALAATKWNLYSSNTETTQAMLYSQTPKTDVSRRFGDQSDDEARVAGEILERHLNSDVARKTDGFAKSIGLALQDRLLAGAGFMWLQYRREAEAVPGKEAIMDAAGNVLAEAVPASERVTDEDVEAVYVYWRDMLWSAGAHHFGEVRWWARKVPMSGEQLIKRFGEDVGKVVPISTKKRDELDDQPDPWARADVWEVWDKEHKRVVHVCEAYPQTLDDRPDPYGLEGFWPFPEPMFSWVTTSKYVPKPDYKLAQDLYEEVNTVATRIKALSKALKVVGVYDQSNAGLQQILSEGYENKLIPVANMAALSEKGGLARAIEFLPIEQVIQVLMGLTEYRRGLIEAIDQITGKSDLQRGQASQAGETATAHRIKARFGSVRLEHLQSEVARFASDASSIRAELICSKFAPETIARRANVEQMGEDPALVVQAIALLKESFPAYRIEIKPESIAYTDFDAQKGEAMEVVSGLSSFLTAAGPLMQQVPGAAPFLLELLQATLARLKGGAVYEGIIDRAIQAAQQALANPQPGAMDPKVQAAQIQAQTAQAKAQAEQQKIVTSAQADVVRIREETAGKVAVEQAQAEQGIREKTITHALQQQARASMPAPRARMPGEWP